MAGPDTCDIAAIAATCEGDQSDGVLVGVDFSTPPVQFIDVDTATAIAPADDVSGIEVSDTDAGGINITATLPGGIDVTGVTEDGFTLLGNGVAGIEARLELSTGTDTYDGDIMIDSVADISANGSGARAIVGVVSGTGNVTITSEGDLSTNSSTPISGAIFAETQSGDISITSNGTISTQGEEADGIDVLTLDGNITVVSEGAFNIGGDNSHSIVARMRSFEPAKTISINSKGDDNSTSGIFATNGSDGGSIFVNSESDFSNGSIFADGDNVSISSIGDFDNLDGSGFDGIRARSDTLGSNNSTAAGNVDIISVGNITVREMVDLSPSRSAISAEVGNSEVGAETSQLTIHSTGNLASIGGGGSDRFPHVFFANNGIEAILSGPADAAISSFGNITSEGFNSPGISVYYRDFGEDGAGVDFAEPTGTVVLTTGGNITTTGELTDAVRIRNGTNSTTTINLVSGDVMGGAGNESAGVNFSSPATAVGIVNLQQGARLAAVSGVAVRGLDGDEIINNAGIITGEIRLGGGTNTFVNQVGGRFIAGPEVNLGGGALLNSGTLKPGADPGGSTFVTGDLVLEEEGTLEVKIQGADQASRIDVTGTTTLDGTLDVDGQGALSAFAAGNQYTALVSIGGISGTFETVQDDIPDLDATVTIVDSSLGDAVEGVEAVQIDLVAATDPDPDPGPDPDPDPEPNPDFSDKSIHPNTQQATGFNDRVVGGIMRSRARSGHVGNGRSAPLSLSTSGSSPKRFDAVGSEVWVNAFGFSAGADARGGISGYDSQSRGILVGVDQLFHLDNNAEFLIGVVAGYSSIDIDSIPSSASVDSLHLGGYARLENGPFLGSVTLGYSMQDFDFTRVIPVGAGSVIGRGTADGKTLSFSAAASYDIAPALGFDHGGRMRIAPLFQFDHVNTKRDPFTETGAGALNLNVDADDYSRSWVTAGVEISNEFKNASGALVRTNLDLRYERLLGDLSNVTGSSIAAVEGATFTSFGAPLDRSQFGLGAGIAVDLSDRTTAYARYDGVFSSGFESHRGTFGVSYRF